MIQAMGLKKRLEHTNCKTAVIGISGGLDSTLALLVTVRAFDLLGKDHKDIAAVTMPGFGTTDRTYDNAVNLIKCLGATFIEVDIKDAVNIHFRDIGQDPSVHDVTYENGQARERTQILMDIANKENGMVIGTGDLSELALGWATYNGDHMSMYAVNASVPKTLVRHLVKYYADTCGSDLLEVHFLMCLIHLFLLSFYHLKTVRFHRRQRILWALMSCMTSSFTICCAAAMLLPRFTALQG